MDASKGKYRTFLVSLFLLGVTFYLASCESEWRSLWPSVVALIVVLLSRSALCGLLLGASCGAVLLAEGSLTGAVEQLLWQQFWPIFGSSWKLSAMLFTLILGGFVALVEAGGGLQGLVRRLLGSHVVDRGGAAGSAARKRMQMTVFGFGLLVFFDGLANVMLIGRLLRSAADRCGVSREKLAYLADTTGSAVACLAFISTWIAFQLSMIREGFALVGQEDVSAYGYFFRSLPTNYYCWFALILALVCVWKEFNPGPMGTAERAARRVLPVAQDQEPEVHASHWGLAIIPIAVLTLSIPVLTYLIGSESLWPFNLSKFAEAYGKAEAYVPQILVGASMLASLVAVLAYTWARGAHGYGGRVDSAPTTFLRGVREISLPVLILVAAWMLGAAISQLGTATWLCECLQGRLPVYLLPAGTFVLGAAISFSTGTSWGTMGVLMPLAISVIFSLTDGMMDVERDRLVVAGIGAVFSGAVFGDHCSPFSDTTIVASIASGVEPLEHVWTQLPFAVIAGSVALFAGFVPLGLGLPALLGWGLGAAVLGCLPRFWRSSQSG
ncbi:Na+/H+ antiporter NhaC family protein [Coraliomargarita sp. SDUM461003]|uniref:Na+/H+ antiporter NhaC family protein n=1 Tax=Thalassobacterium maritimum TaxID=3041265 RepID=A0ABU1AXC8_9BACT|nr:Na+/H+ antiporter NhaC family protein [Coraliomargarita sp. SDUM461003]MDQ8208814.1 Na+/H+ antiporter NhaC family protein [Coraliomargarita sp. SDUM461003]